MEEVLNNINELRALRETLKTLKKFGFVNDSTRTKLGQQVEYQLILETIKKEDLIAATTAKMTTVS